MFRSYDSCVLCMYFVNFLILLELTTRTAGVQENPDASSDFTNHRIVKPILHHGRTEKEIATTKDSSGGHHLEVTLSVSIDGEPRVLELRLHEALVPAGHVLGYQRSGETKLRTPGREELDICQYSGHVRGRAGSWAAVSTCRGVRGVIYDGHQMRYIEPAQHVQDNEINVDHFIYSHEHLAKEHRCGYEGGATSNSSYDPMLFRRRQEEAARKLSRYKRETHEDTQVRAPYNANKLSRYVELVLVVDHGEFRASGDDVRSVHRQMKDLAHIVNSVYAPLNIFIALVGVVIWTERDLIPLYTGEDPLDKFLHYRKTELNRQIPNDNAQLITRLKLQDSAIGRGTVGGICSNALSASVVNNHSPVIGLVAMTIAHELGHNLGMEHDTNECSCPEKQCIMAGEHSSSPHSWSSCSREWLARAFERGKDYCLRNIPKTLFDSPTCGNGFLEEGEECDCGILSGDGDYTQLLMCYACCRPDCTLRANATCGHGQCCDLTTCRPAAAGTECRAALRECDLPEYCTGHSQFCPHDVHKMDATPCGNERAYCVRGSCRSHADQCRLLWGTTGANAVSRCYSFNTEGTQISNCGYDRVRQTYRKCLPQDVACGTLQCHSLNGQLGFGESAYTKFSRGVGNVICLTAVIDLGLSDVDPGLVPDGAKCGHDKMCLRQKCVPVQSVLAAQGAREGAVCPSNCSGHGLCNSEGNCHCESGFAPPLCDLPGPGGSYDSGPASDTIVLRNFMVVMYILFLGIVPSIFIIFLIYSNVHWTPLHKLSRNNTPIKNNSNTSFTNSFENVKASGCADSKQNVSFNNKGENFKKPVVSRKINKEDIVIVQNTHPVLTMTEHNRPKLDVIKTNKNNVKVAVINRKINKEDIVIVQNTHPVDGAMTEHNRPKLDVIKTNKNNVKVPVINGKNNKEVIVQNTHPVVGTMTEHNRPKLNVIRTNKKSLKVPVINRNINKEDIVTIQNTHAVSTTEHNKPKLNVIKSNFADQKSIPTKQATPKPNLSVKLLSAKSNIALLSENRPKPQVISTGLDYANELINQRAKLRKVTST